MKRPATIATVLVLFSPALLFVGIGMIFGPGADTSRVITSASGTRGVGPLPNSLKVTTAGGQTFTLKTIQFTHAATVVRAGSQVEGVTRDGLQVALMSALTELSLWMPANTSAYADFGNYPHGRDASDHGGLGPFQMRSRAGWGTVPGLMDPTYQARAFFGGPTGPNHPSPRGLLNIPSWQTLAKDEAAQTAEILACPGRYRTTSPSPTISSRTPRCPMDTTG